MYFSWLFLVFFSSRSLTGTPRSIDQRQLRAELSGTGTPTAPADSPALVPNCTQTRGGEDGEGCKQPRVDIKKFRKKKGAHKPQEPETLNFKFRQNLLSLKFLKERKELLVSII
ncbi:uncharacterized protein CELE_R11A5.6 [Caenorhabditis elegans]|uniref:Secreted protein n=1 Tax=Caenorhabditis elegans TaxID=6239 RepID=O45716_CAEEL|nr:Secreted protein [Caenorhabditis elegans]CAB05596.1 Secreted protein [Caenorhabditis elegans]|eukprot:NP_492175.1 Uncharacterized protein CELE_R11A5.6 [Caenorhabditis elegans]